MSDETSELDGAMEVMTADAVRMERKKNFWTGGNFLDQLAANRPSQRANKLIMRIKSTSTNDAAHANSFWAG
tara:strand:+ start:1116 stop:1331 length:216 start_codon:yes stop_codon:yes gene_type:complete